MASQPVTDGDGHVPASLLHDRPERLPGVRLDRPVGDAVLGPPPLELLGHLVERPDQRERDVQRVGRVDAEGGRHLAGQARRVVGHHDEADEGVELEVVEAVARRLLDPADLRAGALGRGVGGRLCATRPLAQVDVDAHDVGVAGGEGEHPLAPAADDERGPGLLHRPGRERVPEHLVVLAVEVEGPVGAQQALDDLDRLLEARHPHGGMVVGAARPRRSRVRIQPAPRLSSKRPSLSTSRVAASLASTKGWR